MKNKYEIRGDITVVFLESPKYGLEETIISTSSLERVQEYRGKWIRSGGRGYIYVQGTAKDYTGKIPRLHRWIKQPPEDMLVDHINRNTLDNRDCNLRVATNSLNSRNQKNKKMFGPHGVPGVYLCVGGAKWQAKITRNNRTIFLGTFIEFEDAKKAVEEAIKVYGQPS